MVNVRNLGFKHTFFCKKGLLWAILKERYTGVRVKNILNIIRDRTTRKYSSLALSSMVRSRILPTDWNIDACFVQGDGTPPHNDVQYSNLFPFLYTYALLE